MIFVVMITDEYDELGGPDSAWSTRKLAERRIEELTRGMTSSVRGRDKAYWDERALGWYKYFIEEMKLDGE